MNKILETALNSAKQYMTADIAIENFDTQFNMIFEMTANMLSDTEKKKFIEFLENKDLSLLQKNIIEKLKK